MPRSYGQRIELVEGTTPRELPRHYSDNAGNVYSALLYICRVVLFLPRQRGGAACNGLGTTVKYLRQTTSGVAGIGLGTTGMYMRRTTSGTAGNGPGTIAKYLRGAACIGPGTTIKYL
jgi:hypothetical protein